MTDPPRWLTDAGTPDTVRALLGALEPPAPLSPEKQAALARQLAEISANAGAAGTGALAGAWLKVKVGLVCGVCLGGGLIAAHFASDAAESSRVVAAAQSTSLAHAPGPTATPGTDSMLMPAPASEAAGAVATSAAADTAADTAAGTEGVTPESRATKAPKRGAPSDTDRLAQEEALLERARALAASDTRAALRLLQQHGRRFPRGQLTAERLFLSAQVLERLGEHAAAREQAQALMDRFPRSSYAAKLRER